MVINQKPKNIIMWALTYNCNARCEYCYLNDYKQPKPTIKEEQYFEIAKKIVNSSFKVDAIWLTGGEPTIKDVEVLENNIKKIKEDVDILLPSEYYLSLIYQYYKDELVEHFCPSLINYFFISPWGYIYPCSNENWQTFNGFEFDLTNEDNDWHEKISIIRDNYLKSWPKTTLSSCFSSRCIGCFKVYYDTIFTKNK